MAKGYVTVITTTANGLQPVGSCNVTITQPESSFRYTTTTNEDGRTENIELTSVDKELSMKFQTQQLPFIRYHIAVDCPGYLRAEDYFMEIFDGQSCALYVHLIPAESQIVMPATQYKNPSVKPVVSTSNEQFDIQRIVLPEFIRVKMGEPDEPGVILHIPFTDYVKSVTSALVYPTWPKEAICLVANAVVSNALSRIKTKYYEKMGYLFDITSDGKFDQPYRMKRSIGIPVSINVDEVFNEFVSNHQEINPIPFQFASFVRHDQTMDEVLIMDPWHVLNLAKQEKNALEILRELYGPTYFLIECVTFTGINKRYPGSRLRIGDSGSDVAIMQYYCNMISRQFPSIPHITLINGIFDQDMLETVKAVQQFFFHEPSGYIDKKAWYCICYLYNRIARLWELMAMQREMEKADWMFHQELREGAYSPEVYQLQYMINMNATFLPFIPHVQMNSLFDRSTKNAVLAFQQAFGIPASGNVDAVTWNSLHKVYARNIAVLNQHDEVYDFPEMPFHDGYNAKEVMAAQTYLNHVAQSKNWPRIRSNGIYDVPTKQLVALFQKENKLPVTGTIDNTTWNYLVFYYVTLVSHHPWPKLIVKRNMTNGYVSFLQNKLKAANDMYRGPTKLTDGVYDENMVNAIAHFQKQMGLPVSGEVDRDTWHKLIEVVHSSVNHSPRAFCMMFLDSIDQKSLANQL